MKKIFFQLLTIVLLFFGTWFVLRQVDWVSLLNVKQHSNRTEEKLGDLFWEMIKNSEKEVTSSYVISGIEKMRNHICISNQINYNRIKIHIIVNEEINAFALPNNHLVINSGLIQACETESELCGILSHEIAHMEKNHLMKKLVNEVGLSALISISTGNSNAEFFKKLLKLLTSSKYSRRLESEADMAAVDYLLQSHIDPEPLAGFLFRLSNKENIIPDQVFWISSHPDSEERAKNIVAAIKNRTIVKKTVLENGGWGLLKSKLTESLQPD